MRSRRRRRTTVIDGTVLVEYDHGVWLADAQQPPGPSIVTIDDQPLYRFMDFIYVPRPLTALTGPAVSEVNRLRRILGVTAQKMALLGEPNLLVKALFALLVEHTAGYLEPNDVLEWGCGYHPLAPYLPPATRYTGTDIDPEVIAEMKTSGVHVALFDQLGETVRPGSIGLVLGVFVAHYNVEVDHVERLHQAMHPDGVMIVNVYRRNAQERRELETTMNQAGLFAIKFPDRFAVVDDHEYWVLHKAGKWERAHFVAYAFDGIQAILAVELFDHGETAFGLAAKDNTWRTATERRQVSGPDPFLS